MSRNTVDLHLFSSPGKDDIDWVVEACQPYLESRPDCTLAYLPLASLFADKFLEQTKHSFRGLARIETVNTEMMELPEMESILRRYRQATSTAVPGVTPSLQRG